MSNSTQNDMKKYMFQYATKSEVFEDTGLITLVEAEALWDKWQKSIKENWDKYSRPQMCIWQDCDSNTSYHTVLKEIDFNDCVLENGIFYHVKKTRI